MPALSKEQNYIPTCPHIYSDNINKKMRKYANINNVIVSQFFKPINFVNHFSENYEMKYLI